MFIQRKVIKWNCWNWKLSAFLYHLLTSGSYLYLFRRMKTKRARCRDSRHPGLKHEMDWAINIRKPRGTKNQSVVVKKGLNASYQKLNWHIFQKCTKQSELKLTRTTLKKRLKIFARRIKNLTAEGNNCLSCVELTCISGYAQTFKKVVTIMIEKIVKIEFITIVQVRA